MSETPPNKRGGKRQGAGRKTGTGPFGESTQPIRIPVSLVPSVKAMLSRVGKPPVGLRVLPFTEHPTKLPLPLFSGKVAAGFPSPADDYIEKSLDLNELLVQKPAATFFVRAEGESMLGAGIHPNDILVVDRSLEPVPGKIVICALNGELVVKRLKHRAGQWLLASENPYYPDIPLHEELDMVIWGVVTNVIHAV
jgi:DNA polymerase V